jgi:hypothetical protein
MDIIFDEGVEKAVILAWDREKAHDIAQNILIYLESSGYILLCTVYPDSACLQIQAMTPSSIGENVEYVKSASPKAFVMNTKTGDRFGSLGLVLPKDQGYDDTAEHVLAVTFPPDPCIYILYENPTNWPVASFSGEKDRHYCFAWTNEQGKKGKENRFAGNEC